MAGRLPTVVMDNGTGYTKLGFAGNHKPQFVIPSKIEVRQTSKIGNQVTRGFGREFEDLDFYIGDEVNNRTGYSIKYPIRHGIVEDWDLMQRFWEQCIFKYLRVDPEDHLFLFVEPLINIHENRKNTAEIMFELFNVCGLSFISQAILAVVGYWVRLERNERTINGLVIDSGDSVTRCIPVVDGSAIENWIRDFPIAGGNINNFIRSLLRDRETSIPHENSLETAKEIKERFCYLCPDIGQEFAKYDQEPSTWMKKYNGINTVKQSFSVDVGYERFLGPEIFFHPEFSGPNLRGSLAETVDDCIQNCPIDYRRIFYENIVLSGGSTMFRYFDVRLKRDVQRIVNARLKQSETSCGRRIKPKHIDVNVNSHPQGIYASWFGGSVLGDTPEFYKFCCTKSEYEEYGSVTSCGGLTGWKYRILQ